MDLSIIIVSWKVRDKLRKNLQSLFASETSKSFEVFVVDNNSQDGSVEMIQAEFPQVKLLAQTENLGFAKANNLAIKQARANFILLLNPDMELKPNTLEQALSWADKNPQATVSGCKLIDQKANVIKQVRRFPRLFDQLMIVLKLPHLMPAIVDDYLIKDFDYNKSAKVDSIRGAFFLINRSAYLQLSNNQEPLLDERYFLWFEEVDFCRQVYQLGGEVWYNNTAECLDHVGSSFSQLHIGKAQNYFCDSMLKYFKKWESKADYLILKIAWYPILFLFK